MPPLGNEARIKITFAIRGAVGNLIHSHTVTIYASSADGYIRNWQLISGIPEHGLDYDALPGGEQNAAYSAPNHNATPIRSSSRKIDLARYLRPNEHTTGYAFIWVNSPTERQGLLGMLSDDGIATWLNGKRVWYYKTSRYVPDDTRDIDLPPIALKKGLNALLIKVDQNDGEWALKARVLNPDGSIMRDISLHTAFSDAILPSGDAPSSLLPQRR